jgi:hypothetical protein
MHTPSLSPFLPVRSEPVYNPIAWLRPGPRNNSPLFTRFARMSTAFLLTLVTTSQTHSFGPSRILGTRRWFYFVQFHPSHPPSNSGADSVRSPRCPRVTITTRPSGSGPQREEFAKVLSQVVAGHSVHCSRSRGRLLLILRLSLSTSRLHDVA